MFHCYRIQEQYLKGNNFEGSSTKYRCACFLEQIKFYLNDGVVQTKTNDGRTTGNVRRNENDIFFSKRKRKKTILNHSNEFKKTVFFYGTNKLSESVLKNYRFTYEHFFGTNFLKSMGFFTEPTIFNKLLKNYRFFY